MSKQSYPGASEGERAETGEREPKGAKSADMGGERKRKLVGGVGMGVADDTGTAVDGAGDGKGRSGMGGKEKGEFNSGRSEATCYSHKRVSHQQDK